jgi:hypothetical protein
MAQDTKQGGGKAAERPQAGSVDREPTDEPTPQDHALPVDQDDAPKGQPTSDRFHTEQAHKTGENDPEGS